MVRQLIDSRFRTAIPDHWPSLCTIRQKTYTLNAANQSMWSGAGVDVDGLVDVPARMGPIVQSVTGYDVKRNDRTRTDYAQQEVLLNVLNTSFDPESYFAVIDGVTFEIRGVETDSQMFYTRIRIEITA